MLPLVNAWAEAFMADTPGITVAVSGGGSGVGIASLLNQTTDICMSSRDMRAEEIEKAKEIGFNPEEIDVALDGIAIAVHPSNPLEAITMEQLKLIFTGQYSNWSELGGPDVPILVLSRESSSGTYAYFSEFVMDKEDYPDHARLMPATSSIVDSIAEDRGAVGYIGLGYADARADDIKVLPVIPEPGDEPVEPTVETLSSREYPIARPLHFYVPADRRDPVQQFIDYCQTEKGQEIVLDVGYVPVS